MNERAASDGDLLGPVWHVAGETTFFAGPLTYNASHQHGAPVYLAGLYGTFRIRMRCKSWTTCRTAMVPAGVLHELDCGGDPIAVLYREPSGPVPSKLEALLLSTCEVDGALIGSGGEIRLLRDLYEDKSACNWIGGALDDLAAFSARRENCEIDGRIARVVASLTDRQDTDMSAHRLAASVELSASRFQHLFTQQVGVPFRRYRGWMRMRKAIEMVVAGASFTRAAHEAGFADQAHFARNFRATFGAPASRSLLNVRQPLS